MFSFHLLEIPFIVKMCGCCYVCSDVCNLIF